MGRILACVRELEIERVIVGLPLSLSGRDSEQTRAARRFAASLEKRLEGVPVELYDERFTTVLATRDGGIGSRAPRASEDSRAAAHRRRHGSTDVPARIRRRDHDAASTHGAG